MGLPRSTCGPSAAFRPGSRVRAGLLALTAGALCGCQGLTVTGFRESAQIRVIQASPGAPSLDLYAGDSALAYNMDFAARSSYLPVTEGTYAVHADVAGTRQALGSASSALTAGHQYTAIVGDSLAGLQLTLLTDQTRPAPPGEAALRLVDRAVHSGPLDVYLVPSRSSPPAGLFAQSFSFGAAYSYKSVPAGNYSLAVFPAGRLLGPIPASLLTSPQMSLGSGSVRTIVLMDSPGGEREGSSRVQAVVAEEGTAVGGMG